MLSTEAPADRTPAGYGRCGPDADARLALVRTLRELGLGLDVIRRVTNQELTLGQAAAEHAAALNVQISILRLRQAVLTAAAGREPTEASSTWGGAPDFEGIIKSMSDSNGSVEAPSHDGLS